jgi:hypothetical protein
VAFVGVIQMALGLAGAYFALQLYDMRAGTANDEVTMWFGRVALGFGAVALTLAVWGLTTLNLAFVDFGKKRQVEGRVVRCRAFQRGNNNGTDYFVAVDSGASDDVKAWLVLGSLYASVSEGAIVKATISPRQAHVYEMQVTTPGRATTTSMLARRSMRVTMSTRAPLPIQEWSALPGCDA